MGGGSGGTILDGGHHAGGTKGSGGSRTAHGGSNVLDAGSQSNGDGAPPMDAGPVTPPPVDTVMWNHGVVGTFTPIRTCFTVWPHEEFDGTTRCEAQTDANKACNGERFDSLGSSASELRARVRGLVENTWQRYGQVEFEDGSWGDCPTSAEAGLTLTSNMPAVIDITFVGSCASTGDGGCQGATNNPLPLDEVRGRLGKGTIPTDVHLDWKRLLQGDDDGGVIHEFGHALGFRHSRGDTSCPTTEQHDYDATQGWSITKAFDQRTLDFNSVMGPCPNAPSGRAPSALSGGDIAGIQDWYGRKPDGSLVGVRGLCVSRDSGNAKSSTSMRLCRGTGADQWVREASYQENHLKSAASGAAACLDSGAYAGSGEAPVSTGACAAQASQSFSLTGVQWKAFGDLCLNADTDNIPRTRPCDGSATQRWDFFASDLVLGHIRLSGSTQCVSTQLAQAATNATIVLSPCDDADPKQAFTFPGAGAIAYGSTQYCINTYNGLFTPGERLILWSCSQGIATLNSQFYVTGQVHAAAGGCLGIQNPGDLLSPATLAPCSSRGDEEWDYYLWAP
jgi:hypothetical protein